MSPRVADLAKASEKSYRMIEAYREGADVSIDPITTSPPIRIVATRRVAVAVLAAAAILAGCRSGDATAPSPGNLDIAALIQQMSLNGLGTAGMSSASGVSVPTVPFVPSSCTFAPSTQGFVCPPLTSNGLTLTRSFFLLDAAGHFQSQGDAATTAAIRAVSDMSGTLKLESSGSATILNHQDMTMSGLLTGAHVLNGTATSRYDFVITSPTTIHSVMDGKTVTANLALPKAGAANAWPTGGTMTTDMHTTFDGTPSIFDTHSVLAFDGSSIATLTTWVSTSAGTTKSTCKIDLAGVLPPACS